MAPNGSPNGNLTKELLEKQTALLKDSLERQIGSAKESLEKQLASVKATLEGQIDSVKDNLLGRLTIAITVAVALMAIIGTTLFQVLGLSGQIGETKSALAVQIGEVKAALARSDSGLAKKADVDSVASLTTAIPVSLERIERRLPTTGGQPSPPTPIDLDAPLTLSQLDQLVLRAIFGLNSRDVVTRSRPRNEDL